MRKEDIWKLRYPKWVINSPWAPLTYLHHWNMSLGKHPYIEANQTRLKNWRSIGISVSVLIDLLISCCTSCALTHFDYSMFPFLNVQDIYMMGLGWNGVRGGGLLERKGALLASFPSPQISFSRIDWAFPFRLPLHRFFFFGGHWAPIGRLGACIWLSIPIVFAANTALEALKVPCLYPDWGKYAGRCIFFFCLECLLSSGGNCQPPGSLSLWWKGNKCRMRSLGYESCSDHFALGGCLCGKEGFSKALYPVCWNNRITVALTKTHLQPLYNTRRDYFLNML